MKILCVVLFLGNLCGVLIFLKGFLMNRSEVYDVNSINYFTQKPHYKRIIIILVDALKYEFIDLTNPTGKLEKLMYKLKRDNKFVYLTRFYADPPTTTLQRLKGLMTGSLPTFIDIGSNFGGGLELQEDNLIAQWMRHNYKIDFVGDDTWLQLFNAHHFNKIESYPSFNVRDLDTVDIAVRNFVLKRIQTQYSNTTEIIIGHMLGVDHCGHTYGKMHEKMHRKLMELNDFIMNVTDLVDKETLLIVMGDHGMTNTGDHGGDSTDETEAGLFLISGKPFLYHKADVKVPYKSMDQIDIVPTLAALTSVPVPFSNLGLLNEDLMLTEEMRTKYRLNNIEQLKNFLRVYESKFVSLYLPEQIRTLLSSTSNQTDSKQSEINQLKSIKQHLREKWAKFNVELFLSGIFLSVFCLMNLLSSVHHYMRFKLCVVAILSVCSLALDGSVACNVGLVILIFDRMVKIKSFSIKSFQLFKLNNILYVIFTLNFCINFSNSFIVHEDSVMRYLLISLLFLRLIKSLVSALLLLANKKSTSTNRKPRKSSHSMLSSIFQRNVLIPLVIFLGSVMAVHLGLVYRVYREEQLPNKIDMEQVYWPCILPFIMFIVVWMWFNKKSDCALHNNRENILLQLIIKYFVGLCAILMFVFHSLQLSVEISGLAPPLIIIYIPRIILSILTCLLAYCIYRPIFIVKQSFKQPRNNSNNTIPSLFNYLKHTQNDRDKNIVFVQGLATPYSSFILMILLIWCLIGCLFVKLQFLLGVFCTLVILIGYSILYASSYEWKFNENIFAQFSTFEISLFIQVLSQYSFYATGHQATISNIPWYAAFVGNSGNHTTNLLPLLMILWNIYSVSTVALVTVGIMLPVIAVFLKNSSIVTKNLQTFQYNHENDNEDTYINSGEYFLFMNDKMASRFSDFSWNIVSTFCLQQSCITLSSLLASALHRRHLMAWKIFVPKMLYSCIHLVFGYCSAIIGYLLIRRVHRCTVRWRVQNL